MTRAAEPLTDALSAEYVAWCTAEHVPANTVRRARSVLRSVGNAGTASRAEIEAWWAGRRHLKATTRQNDLAMIRSFYKWCQVWDRRHDDPTVRLKSPAIDRGAPRPPTSAGFRQIREQVRDDPPVRRAVLLAAWGGLRREEIARLDWDDIDVETRTARVLGKGHKVRIVSLSDRLLAELGKPTNGNVIRGGGEAWSADTVGRKVNAAIRAAGVDATIHKLRHLYGTRAYRVTKDPRGLADQMGHASVDTTMRFYAAADDEAGRAIADAVNAGDDDL